MLTLESIAPQSDAWLFVVDELLRLGADVSEMRQQQTADAATLAGEASAAGDTQTLRPEREGQYTP